MGLEIVQIQWRRWKMTEILKKKLNKDFIIIFIRFVM